MAITRQQKEERLQGTQQDLTAALSVVFVAYDKLTVVDLESLRQELRESNAQLRVVPKRLLKLVLDKMELDFDPRQQAGQMAVVWGTDAVSPARILHAFAKKHETVQLVAGSLEGKMLSLEQVKALAMLPSRDELLAKLVGTIAGPVRGFVMVLSGVQRQTVQVLQAIAEQKNS